ncbi:MAG: exo-beta-D-glucosaminidase, partial [Bacteroidota bacterium]
MRNFRIALLTCFLMYFSSRMNAQENLMVKGDWEWEYSESEAGKWLPAVVPGLIHQSLMANQVIPDPRIGTAEKDVQWVGEKDWVFRTRHFEVQEDVLSRQHVEMIFDGLDTYAEVFLNGKKILESDNAFRTWKADVKPFLQHKRNVLEIKFRSPVRVGEEKLKLYDYPIPGDGLRAVTRKPQFHYGWDWGPKLIGCGITGDISIHAWNSTYVSDFNIDARVVTDSLVEGFFQWQVYSHTGGRITIKCGEEEVSEYVRQGWDTLERPFTVSNPRLWFCRGLGEASQYTFYWELYENDEFMQQGFKSTGFRNIELVREKDEAGETFYFRLNGIPVFVRGANYIPYTFFPSSDHEKTHMQRVLASAADVNMNMIRVWGGGVYESEEFYDECDRLGLMVWQDFMFACSMYPGDDAFISNVAEEASQQVLRLRHHPSIALWCGNNENAEGWERWGWQMGLSRKSKESLETAYNRVFHEILPGVVSEYTALDYWPSSPSYGRGDARHQFEGDSHYWGVWHDAEPFEILAEKVPRFMSEFGMQAYPSMQVLEEMCGGDTVSYNHPGLEVHQKHNRGFSLMDQYMERWIGKVDKTNVPSYQLASQIIQAEGIGLGVEAHLRSQPYCMGTMYWQLNDLWPSFSWSGTDWRGNWKA